MDVINTIILNNDYYIANKIVFNVIK